MVASDFPSWLTYTLTGGGGAALTWMSLRMQGALVWRTNAEGYKAEMERQKELHDGQLLEMNHRMTVLAQRIQEQDEEIRKLQARTDILPLLEMSRGIKQIAEDTQNLLNGRTAMIERIDQAVGSPEARRTTQSAVEQIHHLVEEADQRAQENANLFHELRTTVFPMIARVYAHTVERGGAPDA